jgi:hypothetical protein
MTDIDISASDDDVRAIVATARRARTIQSDVPTNGVGVRNRMATEKRALAKRIAQNDGRRLRTTGRTVQLAVRTTPEIKDLIGRLAVAQRSTVIGVIEAAIEVYAASIDQQTEE